MRAWRKRARDGTLPPILIILARGMGSWLLLDGHDRLLAALDENKAVPVLHLFVAAHERDSTEIVTTTRAWPIEGGEERWRAEVIARLLALGLPTHHAPVGGLAPYEALRIGRSTA